MELAENVIRELFQPAALCAFMSFTAWEQEFYVVIYIKAVIN